jgi:large conductance mechanosensitive channel
MKEFKEFISRGNVMDMAVGIIIGGAFTAIVSSLVADIITPIIGMLLGGVNFSELAVTVGSAQLTYGNFIQAIINFLIIAWVVFMMVKAMNKMKKKEEEKPAEPEAPAEPPEDILLLREIRDSLKK